MWITSKKCDQGDEHITINLTRDEAELLRGDLPDPEWASQGGEFPNPIYDRFVKRLGEALDEAKAEAQHAR